MSKIALFRTKSFLLVFIVALAIGIGIALAIDSDNDGMSDLYENFFQLNPTNSTDAAENYDSDLLSNLQESEIWTDPMAADTDADGFPDDADSNALSRAVIFWAQPDFTVGDEYTYTGPAWWLGAGKLGGAWIQDSFWQVPKNGAGALYIDLDRAVLTNNVMMDLLHRDIEGTCVYVDLLDAANNTVATNLFGDLTDTGAGPVFKRYALPLASYANASRILIRATAGALFYKVWSTSLYVDDDADGLDADQETQMGTSDLNADCDSDALTDGAEVLVTHTDPLNPDTDADSLSDGEEVGYGTDPNLPDTDTDLLTDGDEVLVYMTDPLKLDTDGDGIGDGVERMAGLDPLSTDSDGDGIPDYVEFGESYYVVVQGSKLWPEAKADAEMRGGHLVTVGSADEHLRIIAAVGADIFTEISLWTGGFRQDASNDWEWITGEPFAYDRWIEGVTPVTDREDADHIAYTRYRKDGQSWANKANDEGSQGYILEYDNCTNSITADSDGDGLTDFEEMARAINPFSTDTDGDSLSDAEEVALGVDPANADTDLDGISDADEIALGTDPLNGDSDGDGMTDGEEINARFFIIPEQLTWEKARTAAEQRGGHLAVITSELEHAQLLLNIGEKAVSQFKPWIGATEEETQGVWKWVTGEVFEYERLNPNLIDEREADEVYLRYGGSLMWNDRSGRDKRYFIVEHETGTDPLNPDSDGDGLTDGEENAAGSSPFVSDSDGDGVSDAVEVAAGVNPSLLDGDNDHVNDSDELAMGLDPFNPDMDGDGLKDGEELFTTLTDPLSADTDTNGVDDLVLLLALDGTDTLYRFNYNIHSMWEEHGSGLGLHNVSSRSYAEYTVSVPEGGIYRLALQASRFDGTMGDGEDPAVEFSFDDCKEESMDFDLFEGLPEYSGFTPWLSAGEHVLTLSTDGEEIDGQFVIETVEISHVDGPDADGNGMQDWMEATLSKKADTDGDGISDADEILVYGSDVLDADSDGDGLSDGEELFHGTDLLNADSDGDGVLDGEEVHESRTNPLVAEFDGTVNHVDIVAGNLFTNSLGDVQAEGTQARINPMRGGVEYVMDVAQPDVYRLSILAAHEWLSNRAPDESRLEIHLDGLYVGTKVLDTASEAFDDIQIFLPWLPVGEHTIRIVWDNYDSNAALLIQELRLQELGGPDANQNGTKDWVEAYLDAVTGIDPMPESYISPACIEGDALYVPFVSISGGASASMPAVKQSAGDRWYADLPLAEDGITDAAVSFQKGGKIRTLQTEWVAYNLIEHDGEELLVRKGDSVRFVVLPDDPNGGQFDFELEYDVDLEGELIRSPNTLPITCTFTNAGTLVVSGEYRHGNDIDTASVQVTVVDGGFPAESPACMPERPRKWFCPELPTNIVVEAGESIELVQDVEVSGGWETNALLQAPCPKLTLTAHQTLGEHWLVARLFEGGPILDNIRIDVCWSGAVLNGYARVVERYDDMQVWEFSVTARNLPPGVTLVIECIVAGVVFADDFSTSRTITAADFNEQGEFVYRLAQPSGVDHSACHTVKMYQDGVYIGMAFSAGDFNAGI